MLSDWIIEDLAQFQMVRTISTNPASGCSVELRQRAAGGQQIVMKNFPAFGHSEPTHKAIFREMEALMILHHPCIIPLYGFRLPTRCHGPTISTIFAPHGLDSILAAKENVPPWWTPTRRAITVVGLVLGMKFIHSMGLIHRDLKPSNILLDANYHVKICDFGASRFHALSVPMSTGVGNMMYMAPEIWNGDNDYSNKIDIFAFALITYEILLGTAVFAGLEGKPAQICKLVTSGARASIPWRIPGFMRKLIQSCWDQKPALRPSFDEIFSILKANEYKIEDNVDSKQVEDYVTCIT
jgi:serine/threonine protein kinase